MKTKMGEKKYNDRELEKLWYELEDVTMVEDEEKRLRLASKWLHFNAGTYDSEILEWFDKNYSKGVEYLYELETDDLIEDGLKDEEV